MTTANQQFELILKTESRVVSTNLQNFEEQANQYLATLTTTLKPMMILQKQKKK
ncbi:Uncharacterised protein [Mannheimia haemolytica]|uniref:Uncharacterized protein n=1 Tax=Mannheimia haemolytica TaxID=75985 RepID=A0A378N1B9_MANHA|nr:Uncharacterised protein [Mannheimia haemolytica]